jgi:hypothetical protein
VGNILFDDGYEWIMRNNEGASSTRNLMRF